MTVVMDHLDHPDQTDCVDTREREASPVDPEPPVFLAPMGDLEVPEKRESLAMDALALRVNAGTLELLALKDSRVLRESVDLQPQGTSRVLLTVLPVHLERTAHLVLTVFLVPLVHQELQVVTERQGAGETRETLGSQACQAQGVSLDQEEKRGKWDLPGTPENSV